MNEDIGEFISDTAGYLESLISSRKHLEFAPQLLEKLDGVIALELDLALLAAEKAKSSILKSIKDNLVEFKT